MNDYQPTDEQIEALARDEKAHADNGIKWDDLFSVQKAEWIDGARALTRYPAFQAIIRAAQAEAWDTGFDVGYAFGYGDGSHPHRRANTYSESSDL